MQVQGRVNKFEMMEDTKCAGGMSMVGYAESSLQGEFKRLTQQLCETANNQVTALFRR